MQKKIDMSNLDIPKDDIEAWERYPKFNWVYDLSRLLDAQNIKWSPFRTELCSIKILNMNLESSLMIDYDPACIFIKEPHGNEVLTEVYITKGEIKLLRHIDKQGLAQEDIIGEIELRLNAFVALYFQKFTGVITVKTIGTDIFSIILRPVVIENTDIEIIKLSKRIYKKSEISFV